MNRRFIHKSVALTILNGETIADGQIRLPAGTCIGVMVETAGAEPAKPVYLSIKDGGDQVIDTMNHKFLKKTSGGRYIDSVMPIDFQCDRQLELRLATGAAVAADYTVDILFIIKDDKDYE